MRGPIIAVTALVLLLAGVAAGAAQEAYEPGFRFALLSDRTGGHTPGVFQRVIDEINLLNPDFVITMGDHIEGYGQDYERTEAEWDSLLTLMSVLEAPYHMIPGNHDIWDDHSEGMYRARTGHEPHYSFDRGGTHFVVLDVSRIDYVKDFPEDQMAWLREDLAANAEAENVFVFYHKPLWVQTLMVGQPDPLHEVFVEYGVDAVFNAHLHHYFATEFDGIDYTVMGSSGGIIYNMEEQPVARGQFFQFGWMTVDPSGYELAVVDLGGVYPREVVTSDDLEEVQRIESELVRVGEVRVSDETSMRAPVEVTVENVTDGALKEMVTWDVPEGWTVEPAEGSVVLGPGESATLSFTMLNDGDLYPVPRMACRYPMSNGMTLDVDLPVKVMRSASGRLVSEPPVVDGDLSDACWRDCRRVSVLHPPYEAVVEGETEFAFACDRENLYLSAVCYDPQMIDLAANIEERDGAIYTEDCVGYFLQPNPEELTVYQIYVNPLGTVFDQRITFDENMWYTADRVWDGEYEVATQRSDDRWSVEIRIPLDQVGGDIEQFPAWRTNFRRKQARTGASADWQVPIDYNPGTFGELSFQ